MEACLKLQKEKGKGVFQPLNTEPDEETFALERRRPSITRRAVTGGGGRVLVTTLGLNPLCMLRKYAEVVGGCEGRCKVSVYRWWITTRRAQRKVVNGVKSLE
jgi:hypothetical protein